MNKKTVLEPEPSYLISPQAQTASALQHGFYTYDEIHRMLKLIFIKGLLYNIVNDGRKQAAESSGSILLTRTHGVSVDNNLPGRVHGIKL